MPRTYHRLLLASLTFIAGICFNAFWMFEGEIPNAPALSSQDFVEPDRISEKGEVSNFPPVFNHAQENIKPIILRSVRSEKVRDAQLEAALRPNPSFGPEEENEDRYYYNRVDLNGDNRPELLVFLFGPARCASGGCKAFLFQKISGDYKLVAAFGPARNPIIVSETKTNGWRDLIFYNAGGGSPSGYYCVSQFNGQTYPSNPTVEKDCLPVQAVTEGTAYLADDYTGLRFGSGE